MVQQLDQPIQLSLWHQPEQNLQQLLQSLGLDECQPKLVIFRNRLMRIHLRRQVEVPRLSHRTAAKHRRW